MATETNMQLALYVPWEESLGIVPRQDRTVWYIYTPPKDGEEHPAPLPGQTNNTEAATTRHTPPPQVDPPSDNNDDPEPVVVEPVVIEEVAPPTEAEQAYTDEIPTWGEIPVGEKTHRSDALFRLVLESRSMPVTLPKESYGFYFLDHYYYSPHQAHHVLPELGWDDFPERREILALLWAHSVVFRGGNSSLRMCWERPEYFTNCGLTCCSVDWMEPTAKNLEDGSVLLKAWTQVPGSTEGMSNRYVLFEMTFDETGFISKHRDLAVTPCCSCSQAACCSCLCMLCCWIVCFPCCLLCCLCASGKVMSDMSDTKKKLADIEVQDRREPTPVDASGGAFVESDMVGLLRHRRAEMEEEEEMMEMLADLTNDVLHLRVGKMAERAQREAEAQEAATNG
eukprot:TRINITY_DN6124_c0_g1_i1.p1 TRINITY_DN6124_c0_g1~~TRINITY_DN6124_c0_g1_i1.p1  ORF type:complete len:396 (+),score=52.94 TRINITY_DN6124_c0_g1_i1:159-1346(+)